MSSIHSTAIQEHNKHIMQPPLFTSRSVIKYVKTRFTTLVPTKEERSQYSWNEIFNPFASIGELSPRQWNFFLVGLAGWTWDAFDFFAVSLNVSNIAKDLDCGVTDMVVNGHMLLT